MNAVITVMMILNAVIAPLAPRISVNTDSPISSVANRRNIIDTARTYNSLSETMGRAPSSDEILFITVRSEGYALDEKQQEILSKNYYNFCTTGTCTTFEMIRFLSTYESWRDGHGVIDVNADMKALEFYGLLIENNPMSDALYERIEIAIAADMTITIPSLSAPADFSVLRDIEGVIESSTKLSLNTSVDLIAPDTSDLGDLIDVERTYNEMSRIMGREPTMREIMYATIWSEYWMVVSASNSRIGQEAVARSYYEFCGTDGCTRAEMVKFLSGYRPWFGHPGYVDGSSHDMAEYLLMLLNHKYNYDCCGESLYEQIDEILDLEFATDKGWTTGKEWRRASQWDGPYGRPPGNATFGYGADDFAIAVIKYPKHFGMGNNAYFYFVTWEQEQGFVDPGGY